MKAFAIVTKVAVVVRTTVMAVVVRNDNNEGDNGVDEGTYGVGENQRGGVCREIQIIMPYKI